MCRLSGLSPALAPQAHRVSVQAQLSRQLFVGLSCAGSQDDPSPFGHALLPCGPTNPTLQLLLLASTKFDDRGFATQGRRAPGNWRGNRRGKRMRCYRGTSDTPKRYLCGHNFARMH